MSAAALHKIRVVIPYHEGKAFIQRCLKSLEESATPVEEVIIVDNCPQSLRHHPLSFDLKTALTILRTKPSIGFGRACNIGIEHALSQETAVVVLLNQDAVVQPETIGRLTEALVDSEDIFASFPLSLDYEMESMVARYINFYLKRYHEYLRDLVFDRPPQKSYDIGPADSNGSCVALKADILRNTVHFDPIFWMYGEERDMFRRATGQGYRLVLVPAARSGHRHANFTDDGVDPLKFRALHRYTHQVQLLKDPKLTPARACLGLLKFTSRSYLRCFLSDGFPMVKRAFASDRTLAPKIRQALSHRSPEKLQESIQRQMLLDKNVGLSEHEGPQATQTAGEKR